MIWIEEEWNAVKLSEEEVEQMIKDAIRALSRSKNDTAFNIAGDTLVLVLKNKKSFEVFVAKIKKHAEVERK